MELDLSQIAERLCDFVRGQLLPKGTQGFTALSPLRDFGLDSFALIELLLFAESQFGAQIPNSELTPDNLRDIDAFARCIRRTHPA